MKLIVLLCFIGVAFASAPNWQWQSGKEHVFEYSGRLLTGLPQLATHYSGLGIKCTIHLQVKSLDDIRLNLRNVHFSHVNGKLNPGHPKVSSSHEGNNWRHVLLPNFAPAPEDIKELLSIPVSFALKEGEIKTLTVSGAEQEWSLNFKKALVVLFQTKMERSSLDLELNTISKESFETKNYWKVSEETIDGVCDIIYQVNELPDYIIKENSEHFPRMESCNTQKYYEIVKTKELDSCKKSPIYRFLKPSFSGKSCNSIKCLSQVFGSASSVTRYYACGSRSNLILQSIINEGELTQKPIGLKTEPMITGTRQILTLRSIDTIHHEVPKPSQPRVLESVMYEYISAGETLRSQIGMIPKIPQSELKNSHVYKYLPRHFIPAPSSQEAKEHLSPEKVKTELKELLQTVIHDITSVEDIPQKQIPMKIMSIVRGFTFLKFEDLKSLYIELKNSYSSDHKRLTTLRNIYFDAVTVSGTTPAVLFVKEMIRSEEMTKVQAMSVLMILPHHIITPSKEVFTSLFELIQSEVITKSHILYNTAVLSFSNIVQKACLDSSRKVSYPVNVFGQFCDPQSEIVTEKWIPYLTHQLKTAVHSDKRNVIIIALGTLTHKDVIPSLLPIIEGSGPIYRPEGVHRSEFAFRNMSRFLSIYAMSNSGSKHPELVMPVVFSILSNPAENTEIRIAAFNVLMKLNPPMVYLQKIAASTWSEKDLEVLRTIYISISSMSHSSQLVSLEMSSPSSNLVKKCQLILPLLRTINGQFPTSGTIYSSEYLPHMDAGYMKVNSWISNYKSFIPSDIYYRIEYLLGEYQFKPFEFSFKVHGAENIYQKFSELLSPLSNSEYDNLTESEIKHLPEAERIRVLANQGRGGRYTTESRRQSILEEEERKASHSGHSRSSQHGSSGSQHGSSGSQHRSSNHRSSSSYESGSQYQSSSEHSNFDANEHFAHIKHHLHREWVKIIEQLKIETRQNGPLSSLVYLNFFDDISFFGSISEITTQAIRHKITPLLENPSHYAHKVCGKTPINFQRFLNVAPSEFLIPSDMGFPIIIESNMPTVLSVHGHLEISCSTRIPSFSLDTQIMSTNNYHIIVGTFCPFTKDVVATGYKEDIVINLPAKTHIAFDSESTQLKVTVKPVSTSKPVDILYFDTKPFTLHQNYYSFTPKTMATHLHHIETSSPLRRVELPFGSPLGLNFKSIIDTESRYLDTTYMMTLAKMYNYNPMNMLRFAFAPVSVSEKTRSPTLCRHSYRLQYDPSTSATKEVEMTLSVGVATKYSFQEPKYHSIGIKSLEEMRSESTILKKMIPYTLTSRPISEQVHPNRQSKLQKTLIEHLQLRSGAGCVIRVNTVLKGSRPRSFTYEAIVASGQNMSMKNVWHMKFENEPTSSSMHQKICIDGSANIPTVPSWDIDMIRNTNMDFQYHNTIGFGSTCEESKIKIIGTSKVSEKQKHYSRESPVSRECQKLIEHHIPGAHTSTACQETRLLAKTMDEVNFNVKYINTPPFVKYSENKVVSIVKSLLWPYIRHQESYEATLARFGENREVTVRLFFHKSTDTVDMTINRPEEQITFRSIHIPYPMNVFFPMVLGESNIKKGLQSVTGHNLFPVCQVEKSWLRTFDNRSLPLHMDDCYHLISGDCSAQFRFGVLARSVPHSQNKEIKIFMNKTEIIIKPSHSYSHYFRDLKVIVNGTEIFLEKNSKKILREEVHDSIVCEIYRSKDSVIHLSAPQYYLNVKFNGERISVESSQMLKNKLCGICGDLNHQRIADLSGPKKCIYSKPEVEIAAYRISSPHCSKLEGSIKERLETETHQCAKYHEIPTEVYKSFMALVGKCTHHQHMILERSDEVCFSRVPVTQCGAQCSPKPRQLVSKKVSFTCLRNGRMAELYREKAIQGQELSMLKQKHESFSTSILVPQSCVSVISGHPMVSNSGIQSSVPSGVHSGNTAGNAINSGSSRHTGSSSSSPSSHSQY